MRSAQGLTGVSRAPITGSAWVVGAVFAVALSGCTRGPATVTPDSVGNSTPTAVASTNPVAPVAPVDSAVPVAPESSSPPKPRPAVARSATYVALGDSFASGVGSGGPYTGGSCMRSTTSYPGLLDRAGRVATAVNAACGGAKVEQVRASQLSVLRAAEAKSGSKGVGLVTISVGGNDIGYSSLLVTCATTPADCQRPEFLAKVARSTAALGATLTPLYREIRATAPAARIVVMGYPAFFPEKPSSLWAVSTPVGDVRVGVTLQRTVNRVIAGLNAQLAASAAASGSGAEVLIPRFSGHDLTVPRAERWINGVVLENGNPSPDSLHPSAAGYQALARQLTAAIS